MDRVRQELTKIMNEPGRRESAARVEYMLFTHVPNQIAAKRNKTLVTETIITISVHINPGTRYDPRPTTEKEEYIRVCHALNKFHTGKERIPIEDKIPESLREAAHSMHANHLRKVKVKIYSDGSLDFEFVKD